MIWTKAGRKLQKHNAEYRDFFKSIEKLVKYLGEVTAREVVEYEPIVNGLINSCSKDRKKIERTLISAGIQPSCSFIRNCAGITIAWILRPQRSMFFSTWRGGTRRV